jgi:hypothetical protein
MFVGSILEGFERQSKSGLEDVMNEGRPGVPFGAQTNSPVSQPVRLPPPSAGITLRPHAAVAAPAAPPPLPTRVPVNDDPLELVDEEKPATAQAEPPKSKIHGITAANALAQHTYKRPTHYNSSGAVRMRTFHCRLSEQGVEYLDQIINDWLEHHADIEIKFVTSTIGMWDGKLKEPTLILNVWY